MAVDGTANTLGGGIPLSCLSEGFDLVGWQYGLRLEAPWARIVRSAGLSAFWKV
jgi:hypothetical protein